MALNYGDLQSIYRSEKKSPLLQSVSSDFYSEVAEFISKVEDEHREQAKKLVEEIYSLRTSKIIRLASRTGEHEPPKNMVPQEAEMYNKLISLVLDYRRRIFGEEDKDYIEPTEIQTATKTEEEEAKDGKISVRILSAMPAIIGSDMAHYGPFEGGEEVRLPHKTAKILIDKGFAEEI